MKESGGKTYQQIIGSFVHEVRSAYESLRHYKTFSISEILIYLNVYVNQ